MTLIAHWKLDETSGTTVADTTGNVPNLAIVGSPAFAVAGVDGTAIAFGGSSQVFENNKTSAPFHGIGAVTVSGWVKASTNAAVNLLIKVYRGTSSNFYLTQQADGTLRFYGNAGTTTDFVTTTDDAVDLAGGEFVHIAASVDLTTEARAIYVNGTPVASTDSGLIAATTFDFAGAVIDFAIGGYDSVAPYVVDDVRVYDTALSGSEVLAIYDAFAPTAAPAASLPMLLSGFISAPAASLPLRLIGGTSAAAASLPMRLEAPDPTHYRATAARWSVSCVLDGVDISDQITGAVSVEHEETASGVCSFAMIPGSGAIDPDSFERKPVEITFNGIDSGGSVLYTSRRFTGITATASYDPDTGLLSIDGTTDLQGRMENLPREAVDVIVGGSWSEHIFDAQADGWQYAQDRLSTRAAEVHVNNYGHLVSVDWAAKAAADVTLTDAHRFTGALRLSRANRRDLVSRVRVTLDFRFTRLRHREIGVHLIDTFGFCHYLNNGWTLPSKDMVRSAADSNEWVRVSEISYTDLPIAGTYCTPSRGWIGGADAFCLGAFWRAARRWAQTITERYTLDVVATDLEESIGVQLMTEDYGIEAPYDGADFENVKAYDSTPNGAVFSTKTDDWQADADTAEASGRAAMEAAQEVALAKARATLLDRARNNRLTVPALFDPSITLESTVAVSTAYLTAKGKVARIRETLDTGSGRLDQELEIALSRHGGSGLAVDDPLDAADAPEQTQEETSARHYYMQYRIGGTVNCPADNEDWDGYMTNVQASLRYPGAAVYRERLVVAMPEIEAAARDATRVPAAQSFEVEIPEDTLTMSY